MNRSSDTTDFRSIDREQDGAAGGVPGADSSSSSCSATRFAASGGAVFCADPALVDDTPVPALPEGFSGRLSLRGAESLSYEETVSALQRLGMLVSWAQAQQARVAARLEVLFARDIADASGREEPALAMSLAAAEASTVLNIPHMTAMQLISESSRLCSDAPQTLAQLAEGRIALQHARIILEETQNLPTDFPELPEVDADAEDAAAPTGAGTPSDGESGQLDLGLEDSNARSGQSGPDGPGGADAPCGADGAPAGTAAGSDGPGEAATAGNVHAGAVLSVRGAFERDLLAAAEGRTAAGFGRRARRLRESRFPDLIPVRHRQARDKRRVTFQPLPDGMSCLSAIIAAEKGQAMFAALTDAAKAGKRAGDPRTMDQLRADTLAELLLEGEPSATPPGAPETSGIRPDLPTGLETTSLSGGPQISGSDSAIGPRAASVPGDLHASSSHVSRVRKRPRRAERHRDQYRSKVRTEVMVLISADTLAGLNENRAELSGYGPITPETARSMILDALHWTPLLQDPTTGEILNVGRTRRIPAGLKRWLQARDGTCRFPGCSVAVTNAEIDHTTPYSHGGPTDHANLEHLCPKHHRFKTLGHWKARQPRAGTIEWNSPTGRTYTTDPALDSLLDGNTGSNRFAASRSSVAKAPGQGPVTKGPGDDPPPF
ncbi:HNH endonuclease signature motif containing protein [Arthrobacter sp. Edens01]|uniref:HNH endonuclease signature motif containing protein n=1 Tax=Arthrobacter sp. Edens01 TaxID=1732020 RepID=UPI0006DAFF61|nr:HNH endonuclease signature motif containing protein [Arthrobacter sp. Edens01]KPN21988.1 hypothetical protein AO716_03015 [Arthrobacter sp. Edens01]